MRPPKVRMSPSIKRDILRFKRNNKGKLLSPSFRTELHQHLHAAGHDHILFRHIDRWLKQYPWIWDINSNPPDPLRRQLLREVRVQERKQRPKISVPMRTRRQTRGVTTKKRPPGLRPFPKTRSQPQENEIEPPTTDQDSSDDDEPSEQEGVAVEQVETPPVPVVLTDSAFEPSVEITLLGGPQLIQEESRSADEALGHQVPFYPWLDTSQDEYRHVIQPFTAHAPGYMSTEFGVDVAPESVVQREFINAAVLSQEQLEDIQNRVQDRTVQSLFSPGTTLYRNRTTRAPPVPEREPRRKFFTPWL